MNTLPFKFDTLFLYIFSSTPLVLQVFIKLQEQSTLKKPLNFGLYNRKYSNVSEKFPICVGLGLTPVMPVMFKKTITNDLTKNKNSCQKLILDKKNRCALIKKLLTYS